MCDNRTMDWSDVGSRLTEARMQRGLTQAQLAQAIGLERTALAKIEAGQRKISALELAALASELGRRLEWFVLPRTAAVVQHRGSTAPGWVSSDIDVLLEQAVADSSLLVELGHLTMPQRPRAWDPPDSADAAEDLAAAARRLCGIDGGTAVADLTGAVQTVGLLPFAEPLDGGAHAASTSVDDWGVALINSTGAVGRRRLALAHELGHYLVNDGYVEDFRLDSPGDSRHESRLDRFARAFLLPPEVQHAWERHSPRGVRTAAVLVASSFRVDMGTLARRLSTDLGVVDASAAAEIRDTRTTRADIVENDLFVPHDLEGTWLSADYQRAVMRAFRSEDISESRALSLLRGTYEAADLPELPRLDERALWALTQ